MDELAETLDVVIIGSFSPLFSALSRISRLRFHDNVGAFWGEGKRGGRHAAYLCGLRDDNADLVDGEPVYVALSLHPLASLSLSVMSGQ